MKHEPEEFCPRFAVLVRLDEGPRHCVVCGRSAEEHDLNGVRRLTAEDVQAALAYNR